MLSVIAVSMFSLLAVSIDRFWAICYPMDYHLKTKFVTKSFVAGCWTIGTVLGFLPFFGWNSGKFDQVCDVRVIIDFNYMLFVCFGNGLLSTTAIVIMYALTYRMIRKQVRHSNVFLTMICKN